MFQTKFVEKINTHFVFSNLFSENLAIYEIRWKNFVEPDRPQMTLRRMLIACWITKAINTNSECVILTGFLPEQLLRESDSKLRFYIHCFSCWKLYSVLEILTIARRFACDVTVRRYEWTFLPLCAVLLCNSVIFVSQ